MKKVFLVLFLTLANVALAQHAPYVTGIRTKDAGTINPALGRIEQVIPPPVYARWLVEIATCESLPLPTPEQLAKVRFVVVNQTDFQINKDTVSIVSAVSDVYANVLYISMGYMWNEWVVKHEFIHFLLYWRDPKYEGFHILPYFAQCHMSPN